MNTVTLESSPMIHTPGILRWAINGYRIPKQRKAMVKVISDGYGLAPQCATDLLTGKTPHRIEGENVVFEYAGEYLAPVKA